MDEDKHATANQAQIEQDAADAEFFANIPMTDQCSVDECDRDGTEIYRVAPRGICDPGEEERWPVVRFCEGHMREIMGGAE
jgi:hypothetical protein